MLRILRAEPTEFPESGTDTQLVVELENRSDRDFCQLYFYKARERVVDIRKRGAETGLQANLLVLFDGQFGVPFAAEFWWVEFENERADYRLNLIKFPAGRAVQTRVGIVNEFVAEGVSHNTFKVEALGFWCDLVPRLGLATPFLAKDVRWGPFLKARGEPILPGMLARDEIHLISPAFGPVRVRATH